MPATDPGAVLELHASFCPNTRAHCNPRSRTGAPLPVGGSQMVSAPRPRVSRHLLHRTITADRDHVTSDPLSLPEEGILCVYT